MKFIVAMLALSFSCCLKNNIISINSNSINSFFSYQTDTIFRFQNSNVIEGTH